MPPHLSPQQKKPANDAIIHSIQGHVVVPRLHAVVILVQEDGQDRPITAAHSDCPVLIASHPPTEQSHHCPQVCQESEGPWPLAHPYC